MCAFILIHTAFCLLLTEIQARIGSGIFCEWGYGQIALIVNNLKENEHLGKPKCVRGMIKLTIL